MDVGFSFLNDLNHTGKKLWTARAIRTRNNTWRPERTVADSQEAENPRSAANCIEVPLVWTNPARAARTKPRLRPVPNKPRDRIRHSVVNTRTAPIATTSSAIATASKATRHC